ncbi:MAG TPA: aldo/keto reductase [Cellulomonas sp.]|uniref:aldo/keto reductase n=1 Tax=Cellulomonas sp. TaxID=40001 RepID=UPI002E361E20|nr:aldo/keto reductase [Cellulomonas sp.]HEX5332719.1 aldo/keto reductase [Cellulomonas sp.]
MTKQSVPLLRPASHGEVDMAVRPLGNTRLAVSGICVGTSALGGWAPQYGYDVDAATAVATVRRALEGPFNFIDTANEYGSGGSSERRIGRALAEVGGLPPGFVIGTKIDPLPGSAVFTGARARQSVEESLDRLGLSRLQLVYLHDPQRMTFDEAIAPGGPVAELVQMRDEGVIEHIGIAGGSIDLQLRYLLTGIFDVVINHNKFTLIDQTAEPLMNAAAFLGVAFVNAAPFGGGILAKGPEAVPRYSYVPATERTLRRVRAMRSICDEYSIPLAAVALQFSQRDPRVASTIVGMSQPSRIDLTAELAAYPIPGELWRRLRDLISQGQTGAT